MAEPVDRLTASEERYRMLVAMSPDGISVADRTGKIIDCNEQFARMHGHESRADVIGRYAAEFVQPEEFERLYKRAAAGFERGEKALRGVRVEVLRRDGSVCTTEYSIAAIPWPDAPGGTAYISNIRDITRRIELLAALEEHQASLEAEVQQRTRDLETEIAKRARLENALTQRVEELSSLQALGQAVSFAHPLDELVSIYLQRLIDVAHADFGQLFLARGHELKLLATHVSPVLAVGADGDRAVGESLSNLVLETGETVYLGKVLADPVGLITGGLGGMHSLSAFPLRSAVATIGALVLGAARQDAFAGRLPFLQAAADMIAGRVHNARLHQEVQERAAGLEEAVAERTRELQTERDRTQAILETVGESVVVADNEGNVLFANPATVAFTGYSRDEILGQPLWSRWSAQTLAKAWPDARRAVQAGRAWHGEITGHRADGTTYTAGLTGTPLYDVAASGPIGSVWVQRDITVLKEAERLKDQFVSNVSHELRTPISILTLTSDNLEAYWERVGECERRQMVRDIHEQAHLLSSLAEDILRISQIDSGRVPAARSRVDLGRLVREEVAGLRPVARRRGHRLDVIADTTTLVMGNEMQLRQIVRNLLDNAIKFTPTGGSITCGCESRGTETGISNGPHVSNGSAWAVLDVTDTGIGISASDLSLIFERFYRVHTESDIPGTGLGLSIAQELTKQHGGWIGVASTPGMGSTFSVHLPLCQDEPGGGA